MLMTGELIDLGRRFRPATEDEERPFLGLFDNELKLDGTWSDLRKKRRVIVLAEAGSGKSSEFRGQRDGLRAEGKFAFYVSVRDVAQAGLEAALPPADRSQHAEWKADPDAECWLFVDSVDEAKDQGHHFDSAARNLEHAIAGAEERVHLYISSRFTDWDKTADRLSMETWLSLPQAPPPPPDLEEEVRSTLQHREKPSEDPVEEVAVLVLEPLTNGQVRRFAEGSGITNVDALLDAIEDGNLWSFAARPLDLGWMVDYWQSNKRLGSLRDMIEASIKARLLDPDPQRRRTDSLDGDAADRALDRIGAGFLLCGKDSLRVPAAGVDLDPPEKSIPLEAMLPEWSDGKRLLLLSRAVFDPATLGRARLHNDNRGTLRCYLTACWLARRLEENCPLETIFDILFADLYGYRLVRPDMVETSAWLAGQVPAIADELISRSPLNLLSHGDPGSLPIPTRVKAFDAAIEQVDAIDPQKFWFIEEPLRRFAHPALNPHFPDWWAKAKDNEEAQHLVLRLIHIGRQHGGIEIVRTVAFDHGADEISQLIAARALIGLGTPDDQARYAQHLLANYGDLARSIVLQALDLLFPDHISVDQFFTLIDAAGITDSDGHASILPIGPALPEGLRAPRDLEEFLEHVVARSGTLTGEGQEHPFRDAFSKMAIAAAVRLLGAHPDAIPDVVTDVTLLFHEARRYSGSNDSWLTLADAFGASPGRRRSSFWRAAARAREHPWTPDRDDVNLWLVQHLGWPVRVDEADFDWFIADVRERTDPRDRLTALRAAHMLWRQFSNEPDVLARLEEAARIDPALAEQLAKWQSPPPESVEMVAQTARMEEMRQRNEQHAQERDKSWVDLIATLRADPSFLDRLSPQTDESVDSRLFHLWQFLSWRTQSRTRYSIAGLDIVEPIFGPELTRRFRDALIAFAYARTPSTPVETASEHRAVTNFDIMALGGMSLAAATIPDWADALDVARVGQAARLAIIELNGFPDYLVPLAMAHPDAVRQVLMRAVEGQLSRADPQGHGMLDRLEYADETLAELIVGDLEGYLEAHPTITPVMLEKIVSVLMRTALSSPSLQTLATQRVRDAQDPLEAAYYLLLLFGLEGDTAVDTLREKMAALDPREQAILCCTLLPRLFGDRIHRSIAPPTPLSVDRLVQLLILAFDGVRPDEDIHRPSGEVYSPDIRDEAEDARNMIFDRITKTPGEATHAALLRLAAIPDFHIRPDWVRTHALRRAEADAELVAWMPSDVLTFERTSDRAPTTTADLQFLARRRIEGIQHDLINGRFAQGDTLQGLVDENSVQRWLATQFDARNAESYIVQRETHYADEKEPDISLTSRHSGAELPIEVKIVDGMTVAEMEAALRMQLCGQYLRHSATRHGILLLVYQEARAEGWILTPGEPPVAFEVVLHRLQEMATAIREGSATGPQPIVAEIDVSRVVPLQKKRQAARARTLAKKATTGRMAKAR